MMNREQADALRRENEARSAAQWRKTQDSFASSNARTQQQHQAAQQAQSTADHNRRMGEYARAGKTQRESLSSTANYSGRTARESVSSGGYAGSTGKSKGGGLAFVVLVFGAIVVFGHSGSNSSVAVKPNRAPIEDGAQARSALAGKLSGATPESSTLAAPVIPSGDSAEPTSGSRDSTDEPKLAPPTGGASVEPTAKIGGNSLNSPGVALLEPVNRPAAEYPAAALQARPSGDVILEVGVQTDGTVITTRVESGDPLLVPAALEAVKRWTFRPYPYEAGASVRTIRIAFEFSPPANYTLPANNGAPADYTLPSSGGIGPG